MRTAAQQRLPDYLSLWAGQGVARARAMPAGDLAACLIREMAS
jgi:nitronate monooxygenase